MIPYAKLIGAAGILALLAFGCYRIYDAGRDSVQAKWDADKALRQAEYDKAVSDRIHLEKTREKATKEIQDDLQAKLDATRNLNRDLANRLRDAFRSNSTVSQVPDSAGDTPSAPRIGGDQSQPDDRVREALAAHLEACQRDAVRLGGWQEWYNLMSNTPTPDLSGPP